MIYVLETNNPDMWSDGRKMSEVNNIKYSISYSMYEM